MIYFVFFWCFQVVISKLGKVSRCECVERYADQSKSNSGWSQVAVNRGKHTLQWDRAGRLWILPPCCPWTLEGADWSIYCTTSYTLCSPLCSYNDPLCIRYFFLDSFPPRPIDAFFVQILPHPPATIKTSQTYSSVGISHYYYIYWYMYT